MPEEKTEKRQTVKGTIASQIIAETIRNLREATGMTQGELSRVVGRERTYVHKVESLRRMPDVATFIQLLKACGADPGEVVNRLANEFGKKGA